jgi:hypothetical protein
MTRRVSDYSEFLSALRQTFVESYEFSCSPPLDQILKEPRLIIASNHATPLSWLPAMTTLAHEFEKAGGGDRSPRGVLDKWFYTHPLLTRAAEYLSQYNRPQSFDELLTDFGQAERTDLIVFPEGANTFFGDVHEIQNFRSSRFVELSIRSGTPILLVVHAGSEDWSLPVHIPPEWIAYVLPFSKFFGEGLLKAQALNFPWWPKKISRFRMKCRLYQSALKTSELSADPDTCRSQVQDEAQKVRTAMLELLAEIKV